LGSTRVFRVTASGLAGADLLVVKTLSPETYPAE